VADNFENVEWSAENIRYLNGHQVLIFKFLPLVKLTNDFYWFQLSVTCVTITQDNKTAYSGSKDNAVIAWDVETGAKQIIHPHWRRDTEHKNVQSRDGEVLAVAVSSDSRYVVSGGRDNEVKVYDVRNKHALIRSMKGHRDAVTGLCFRKDTYSLYSSSLDRCLKHWEIGDLAYMETLFGHQASVLIVSFGVILTNINISCRIKYFPWTAGTKISQCQRQWTDQYVCGMWPRIAMLYIGAIKDVLMRCRYSLRTAFYRREKTVPYRCGEIL
jgi:WD40 repeat protein